MTIKTFVFNHYQLNTYLLYDDTNEGVIIDAGNSNSEEDKILFDFIAENNITIKELYYTHAHVDHIVGNNSILKKYNLQGAAHIGSLDFFKQYHGYASTLGFRDSAPIVLPKVMLNEGDVVRFGNSKLEVIETHGHANGSLSYYAEANQFVIVGDVLFKGSIGRTDLPTGDFDILSKNIVDKLYNLPNNVKVYSGHGPNTTIGYEKMNNPFVNMSIIN